MHTTYVLYSPQSDRLYIGQTDNLSQRMARHNQGEVRSTKACRPWKLVHFEQFFTRADAMRREKQLKSHKDRTVIRQIMLSGRVRPSGPAIDGQLPD